MALIKYVDLIKSDKLPTGGGREFHSLKGGKVCIFSEPLRRQEIMKSTSKNIPDSTGYNRESFRWGNVLKILAWAAGGLVLLLILSVLSIRWVNPPVTAFTLQQDWEALEMERSNLRDGWVPREELPYNLKWAVIASEDQRFWDHRGFDFESIREALEEQRQEGRIRGASTISQQVAKNLYLWPAQSYFRKGLEAGITVLIELFWPKERILEVYLNVAEFGPGIFGAGKASEVYFGLPASQLEPEMSARLAAVLPNPKRMRVEPPSPYTKERSRWILRQMTHLTGIPYLPLVTSDPEEDPDPLPWDFDFELELDREPSAIPAAPEPLERETLPDSLPRPSGRP
ncbi:MAG: monofunctional biosynthetic peptidoglycan transglycosylase [Balneolaceae bacterium]